MRFSTTTVRKCALVAALLSVLAAPVPAAGADDHLPRGGGRIQ